MDNLQTEIGSTPGTVEILTGAKKKTATNVVDRNGTRANALKLINGLSDAFIGREEEARLAVMALTVRQHLTYIGSPGTAKSALISRLCDAVNGQYFYYLMGKHTIPDELIGPIDPIEYKNGKFTRMMSNRLPQANIAFLDEVFKSSTETLNTILNIMNERMFVDVDGKRYHVPLISLFSASNELPEGDDLQAFYDRILLKHFVKAIDPSNIERGILLNIQKAAPMPKITMKDLDVMYKDIWAYMAQNSSGLAKAISSLVVVMRQHGIFVSDRTAMNPSYLPMLIAAHSYIFESPLKKSAISMSKYILSNNEEQLTNYSKALDSLYPPELRTAQEKLEKAGEGAAAGNLGDAKKAGLEAITQIQAAMKKESLLELYSDEISDLYGQAEKIVSMVNELQENLKSFKVRKQ